MVTLSAASFLQQQKLQTAVRFSIIQYGEIALFMNLKLQIKSCKNTLIHIFTYSTISPHLPHLHYLPPLQTSQTFFPLPTSKIDNW